MKIRWTQSSLRARITPTELGALVAGSGVSERLGIETHGWKFEIVPAERTNLTFTGAEVCLEIAQADISALASEGNEGVYFQSNDLIRCSIEKDFPCAHPRAAAAAEPDHETFEPPADFAARKRS